jgi:DNA repair protein RecN (Recombination protein N)
MLKRLRIKNFALIDELEVDFGEGLNVITGTTGAGKSIIVGAIEFALGKRGSDEIVRTGKDSAAVEAEFEVSGIGAGDKEEAEAFITDKKIVIKRNYRKQGGGKAYVGNKPVNLPNLKTLSGHLISILGQHSHQVLLDPAAHIGFLDSYAELHRDLAGLRDLYDQAYELKNRLSHAGRNALEVKERIELLEFQITEIEKADMRENEEEPLKSEKRLLENARVIRESGEMAISALLEADGSAVERIGESQKALRDVDTGQIEFADILGLIGSAADSINEAALKIRNFIDAIDDNPVRLEEINSRLQEIFRLRKKYQADIRGILDYAENSRRELCELRARAVDPESIRKEFDEKSTDLSRLALKISDARKSAAKKLEKFVTGKLSEIGLQKARFVIDFAVREEPNGLYFIDGRYLAGDHSGFDKVEFMFCANPGEGLKPLAAIASGGEISRVMLALKNAFLVGAYDRCEIFDEIDVGISGEVAARVAEQLKKLAGHHQVICVTHLPQIASQADHHFRVFKTREKGRSVTRIEELHSEDRVREIAALLSGKSITPQAIKGAREILKNAGS